MTIDIIVIRAVFVLILVGAGFFIQPIPLSLVNLAGLPASVLSAVVALILAVGIIFFELRIRIGRQCRERSREPQARRRASGHERRQRHHGLSGP